jgi:hypothetical protein
LGRFDDGDISDPEPGGYGLRGSHQYERLAKAIEKDRPSALQSTSWGIGQIMGENFVLAGFNSVDEMVTAMSESEDQQLGAMGEFLLNSRLNVPLQTHDWTSFARGYNGPHYAINRYDLNVRAAQLYLAYLGFHPGPLTASLASRLCQRSRNSGQIKDYLISAR